MPTHATITPKKSRRQWAQELRRQVTAINALQRKTLESLIAFGKALKQACGPARCYFRNARCCWIREVHR